MALTVQWIQWILVIASSIALYFLSPKALSASDFFKATHKGKQPSMLLLTGSLVISWIMAKSIANTSDLGYRFGLVGGVAYACYYLSFAVAGWVIYRLRTKGHFKSIHHFLSGKFGRGAVIVFSLLIGFRLFNEVWSNTIVIGSYYGDIGTTPYYVAVVVFTALTLLYALKGGLSSSIFTDVLQLILFSTLLGVILYLLMGTDGVSTSNMLSSGEWSFASGLDLMLVALVQCLSYPFHDPVLTDRGFISEEKSMLKSYLWASVIGFVCIVMFSFVGIYARESGLEGTATVAVAQSFGIIMLLVINFIMITSAASTLDSTFSSFSKLISVDLKLGESLKMGRLAMGLIALLGTIPVFLNPEVLSATTISGTMVIGLAPIFLFWNVNVPRISYHLSVFAGIALGILLMTKSFPSELILTEGKYADLLWINVWGTLVCTALFFLPKLFIQASPKTSTAPQL